MGGSLNKLRKQLERGDEFAALQLCERHPDLRKSLDPNASYGPAHGNLTPLHLAAKHSMKALIRIFLHEMGGNPNKKSGQDLTSLHLVCQGGSRLSRNLEGKIRAEALAIIIAWEGPRLQEGEPEKADLNAVDQKKNTALHFAAASGLNKCVEMLVAKGADLFLENEGKETPCDSAERCGNHDIAEFLETKMVFSSADRTSEVNEDDVVPVVEQFNGLREQDLIEAKDLLLVETSDMLQVPLFTAEALLRNHEWSRQALWQAWKRDAVACCERCGVQPPLSALEARRPFSHSSTTEDTEEAEEEEEEEDDPALAFCEICMGDIDEEGLRNGECGHRFCRPCWKQYATVKIQEGDLHSISCPAFECAKLVPLDVIERVVSPSIARRYLTFDIKAFVESNPRIKWCPFPGCNNAVRLPDAEEEIPLYLRVFPKLQPPPPTSKAVSCPHGHQFCWDCSSDGHEPTSCDKWREWLDKIHEIKPEELSQTGSASESAANCLWLVTHSKPCPKCRSPIQKNEGCNHMKCSKCKQDFCWVCLGPWKKHSTDTGGYFRCNRYDESRKIDDKTEQAIAEAKEQSKKAQELNRFVHYYSRYKNHLNSYAMEKEMVGKIEEKVASLSESLQRSPDNPQPIDFSFVRAAVEELLRSRKALSSSYAYGYFLKDCGYNKTIFEYLQNELEVSVETLSGLVGRSYLRGSHQGIVLTTNLVACRRQRFLLCISRGLVPPETPPGLRNANKRSLPAILGLDKDDDDWAKSGLPPLENMDPLRPWVKDTRGKHHNLTTILDWPEEESMDPQSSVPPTPSMICVREGCSKTKAKNPRTGDLHSYCSLRCQYLHNSEGDEESMGSREYNVDLMIALQMSRLQLLHDLEVIADEENDDQPGCSSSFTRRNRNPNLPAQDENIFIGEDVDPDLQLAIERSVADLPSSKEVTSLQQFLQGIASKSPDITFSNSLNQVDKALALNEDKKVDKVLIPQVGNSGTSSPGPSTSR